MTSASSNGQPVDATDPLLADLIERTERTRQMLAEQARMREQLTQATEALLQSLAAIQADVLGIHCEFQQILTILRSIHGKGKE
jgi:hypothetical protein